MVLGLTPASANVLAVWPWRRNVITLRLTGFLVMELRNAHASQCGFKGSVKECIQRAWNQLINRWCWPLFYCCVCGCQGWWTERTTDAGGGGVGMQVGQEGTSQGGASGAQWPGETRGLWDCSGTDRERPSVPNWEGRIQRGNSQGKPLKCIKQDRSTLVEGVWCVLNLSRVPLGLHHPEVAFILCESCLCVEGGLGATDGTGIWEAVLAIPHRYENRLRLARRDW